MKPLTSTAVLVAAALAAGVAFAQGTTKNDGTPSAAQPQTTAKPAINNPAKQGEQAAKSGGSSAAAGASSTAAGDVRDWNQIDTNDDNLISGEEMEKYLASNTGTPKK